MPSPTREAISTKRNEIVAHWAADVLGLSDEQARAYAGQIIHIGFEGGDGAVLHRILKDFVMAERPVGEPEIELRMHELMVVASRLLMPAADE